MAAGSQPVASGVVQFVVFSIAPALMLWLVLHAGPIVRLGRRAVSRLRAARPPLRLAGPPLEQIAADIRRIAAGIETMPAQAPLAQRHGALLAYDDALVAACRALGVEERLNGMPLGPARHAERLRIECELQYEGLVIGKRAQRDPHGRGHHRAGRPHSVRRQRWGRRVSAEPPPEADAVVGCPAGKAYLGLIAVTRRHRPL